MMRLIAMHAKMDDKTNKSAVFCHIILDHGGVCNRKQLFRPIRRKFMSCISLFPCECEPSQPTVEDDVDGDSSSSRKGNKLLQWFFSVVSLRLYCNDPQLVCIN